MNSDYCSSCGNKMEYLLSKPKFCPSCGVSLGGVVSPTKAAPKGLPRSVPRKAVSKTTIKDDADGTDVDHVPQIGHLQYEVDADYSSVSRRVPLAQILGANPQLQQPAAPVAESPEGSASPPPQPAPKNKKPTTQAQFDVVKKTIEECKSSAQNVVDVGEE